MLSRLGLFIGLSILFLAIGCSFISNSKESPKTIGVTVSETTTKNQSEISLTDTQKRWESYLYSILIHREMNLLFTQQDFEINLDEYIKQGKISIKGNPSEMESIKNDYDSSYFVDMDQDGVDELYVITCEGSIRQYYGTVYKKENEDFVVASTSEGHIIPVKYNKEVHFISIESDFETKFTNAVIEYEINDLAFKPKEILNIKYTYEASMIPETMTKIIDARYLNTLSKYEIGDSNTASITKISEQPSYDVRVIDEKYKNVFNFNIKLWLTSVGYAPNHWEISTKDDSTHHFKGVEKIASNADEGTDDSVCYGLRFYKDESDQLFLLKISYPFYTMEARKDGDLILQLFKFNRNDIEEIDKLRIEPKIEVDVEMLSA
ncbi:hypothetical protein PAENIP36_10020 [Paenibacillus sp. P36]